MKQKVNNKLQKMLSFWVVGYSLAIVVYFILYLIMPDNRVLLSFDWKESLFLIAIPCFLYGILATYLSDIFLEKSITGKIGLTLVIYFVPILVSAPISTTVFFWDDLNLDTYILAFICGVIGVCATLYTWIGLILCFFVTQKISEYWYEKSLSKF